jgi:cephalosporin-C deacetylase-like acetyl esterase
MIDMNEFMEGHKVYKKVAQEIYDRQVYADLVKALDCVESLTKAVDKGHVI